MEEGTGPIELRLELGGPLADAFEAARGTIPRASWARELISRALVLGPGPAASGSEVLFRMLDERIRGTLPSYELRVGDDGLHVQDPLGTLTIIPLNRVEAERARRLLRTRLP